MAGLALLAWLQAEIGGEHRITDIFKPLASPARGDLHSSILVLAVSAAIFVVVGGLIVYTMIRFRQRPDDDAHQEPPQVYGSNQLEIAWTIVPLLIVFVLIGVTARIVDSQQNAKPPADALHVTVIGHQWWWEFQYPQYGITTANELHVPAAGGEGGRETFLRLESADVIHSFWVPQLAGKTDVIPNRTNTMWMDPKIPGVYVGNCAEYCGTQHANMLIHVMVDSPADFDKWVKEQQQPALNNPANRANQMAFYALACIACHAVRGTPAIGKFGPDLTHLMSRKTLASGMIPNNTEELMAWVDNPQQVKPGCLMPSMKLTQTQLKRVVAYLETLK